MKRIAMMACVVLGLALTAGQSSASWGEIGYSGYQPWYNIFAKRYKGITPEEERLQKFWHDYYDAMKNYYGALDHIDWVAYYKNHGYVINNCGCGAGACGGCSRINYAPVVVSPNMMWCVPNGPLNGPPCGPSACAPSCGPAVGQPYQANYPASYPQQPPQGYGQLPPAAASPAGYYQP